MNKRARKLGVTLLFLLFCGVAALAQPSSDVRDDGAWAQRIAWFREAKFGLFVHWGPFSLHGADPNAAFDYFQMKGDASVRAAFTPYALNFRPQSFDAKAWMDAAESAGMRYVVFTSKHHDGYSMFETGVSDYDAADQAPQRDYVRELVKAARTAGLKIGFYYSLLDWYHPDFGANMPRFVEDCVFRQVRELCTQYGEIDCLWFDGEWDYPAEVWRAPELVGMIRQLQPNALVNDRIGKGERGVTTLSDFYTREQPSEVNVAMPFERQQPFPWEACVTIGDYWQYSVKDGNYKSAADLVRLLVDVVSRGGNLLLNVGPTPDGVIPEHLLERLHGIGAWMKVNGDAIYGTQCTGVKAVPEGKCVAKDDRLFVFLDRRPGVSLRLDGVSGHITGARMLSTGNRLSCDASTNTIQLPESLPEDTVSVIEVAISGK